MTIALVAVAALLAGYLLGRARPWNRLADWAHDQIRHGGTWYSGSKPKQAVLPAAWAVTAPGDTWRAFRNREQEKQ